MPGAPQDAYFYCQGKNDLYAMGVADGVYMWRESGIDSGKFSRTLMRLSEQNVRSGIQVSSGQRAGPRPP